MHTHPSQASWKPIEEGVSTANWWYADPNSDRLVCDLCPRQCHLKSGDRGFCFVRENRDGQMVLNTYGRSTGFCIDPIEKKPLHHFFPGTSVLSFGTAGCNLGCKFCQNWDISKSREVARLSQYASPEAIAIAAKQWSCTSVAFTYNDPVVWAEYAIDTAMACHDQGIKTVAVTAGYISPAARGPFFQYMDAANVDLKAFSEEFYHRITYSHLQPVLDTLVYLQKETDVWFEITNLVIPQANDDPDQWKQMCDWILQSLGPDVPLHFSAFHPDFRMTDRPNTPHETLIAAHDLARSAGLRYVYVGNVHDDVRQNTYCSRCHACVIQRDRYDLGRYDLNQQDCRHCGTRVAGRFGEAPGNWGRKRQPIQIRNAPRQELPVLKDQTSSQEKPLSQEKDASVSIASSSSSTDLLPLQDIDSDAQQAILRVASRLVVASTLGYPITPDAMAEIKHLAERRVHGIFVTLKRREHLRGCCGLIGKPLPLQEALSHACHRTAREDSRMPAISPTELAYLSLDVTILGPSEPLTGSEREKVDNIQLGTHGLRIQQGNNVGLLLPSVPIEQGWDCNQFLRGVCRKAGLDENAWQQSTATLERFTGLVIHGTLDVQDLRNHQDPPAIVSRDQIQPMRTWVAQNILALLRGATPSYFAPGLPDGNVHGLVLSLFESQEGKVLAHLIRASMRPGMPLQSTLFELAETAAQSLRQAKFSGQMQLDLSLTVMHDPCLHGQAYTTSKGLEVGMDACHLDGLDTQRRAIIAMMGGSRVSVAMDPSLSAESLVQEAMQSLDSHGRPVTIYSMEAIASNEKINATSVPHGQAGAGVRQPFVAGAFYEADDHARQSQIQRLLDAAQESPRNALAIMTPHAGLKYSGEVAARVWKSTNIPRRVLILGPKHTAEGVDWAVAPHRKWQLSSAVSLDGDTELSQRIATEVFGMQWDAAAHRREHGTEVQLPFLEYLAPKVQISSIAMHGASWPEIDQAAKQLATLLNSLDEPPLLVISSDMNHYANDEENRRRDRLALDAMLTLDPRKLLDTCEQHQISMCGVLPAALVMQTLHYWKPGFQCRELSYATSAQVSGDTSRVVGYASLQFLGN